MNFEKQLIYKVFTDKDISFDENLFTGEYKELYIIVRDWFLKTDKFPNKETLKQLISDKNYKDDRDKEILSKYIEVVNSDDTDIQKEYIVEKLREETSVKNLQTHINTFNHRSDEIGILPAIDELTANLLSVRQAQQEVNKGYVYESAKERFEEVEERRVSDVKLSGVDFNIKCLNDNLGGRNDSTMMCFVGLPGTGKTIVKLNLAYNLARFENQHVMFCSGELKKRELEYIVDARDSMIDSMLIRAGTMSESFMKIYKDSLHEQRDRKDKLYIVEFEPDFTVRDIIGQMMEYKRIYGVFPSTIVADYMWIMDSIRRANSFAEKLGNVAFELRHLVAKKYGVCVITSTQESRTGALMKKQGKERTQESIGESHKIAPHCHTIIMLDTATTSLDEEIYNKISFSCVKNTLGRSNWKEDLIYLREYGYVGDKDITIGIKN